MSGRHAKPTSDELDRWADIWNSNDPDRWMADLRRGGTRVEHRMRATYRERGALLVNRVGRRALRLRAALAKTAPRRKDAA